MGKSNLQELEYQSFVVPPELKGVKALVGEIVLSPAERENNFSSWGERGTAVEDAVQCSGEESRQSENWETFVLEILDVEKL